MSELPDELWRHILEVGVSSFCLRYRDLCCLSISCRRLRRLSGEDSLWSAILSSDFPRIDPPSSSSTNPSDGPSKSLYKTRFLRDRAKKRAALRREVLRMESHVATHSKKLEELRTQLREENQKLRDAAAELQNLHRARQASVALNVWQPELVRGWQKQVVEQSSVPAECRINNLQMETRLSRKLIDGLEKAIFGENLKLQAAEAQLESLSYHPLKEKDTMTRQASERIKRRRN